MHPACTRWTCAAIDRHQSRRRPSVTKPRHHRLTMSIRHLDSSVRPRLGGRDRRLASAPAASAPRSGATCAAAASPGRCCAVNPKHARARRRAGLRARGRPARGARPGRDLHAAGHGAGADRRTRRARHARRGRAHRRARQARSRQAMLDAARPHLLRILGPNCLGLLAPHARAERQLRAHRRAARRPRLRLAVGRAGHRDARLGRGRAASASRTFVSLGEHADVDFGDMLDYLASDADDTRRSCSTSSRSRRRASSCRRRARRRATSR